MKFYYKILSIVAIAFLALNTSQFWQKYKDQRDLKIYYATEMEDLYTKFYEVDSRGLPVMLQSDFKGFQSSLVEQMLADGFNRAQIKEMEELGRSKGHETRRFWDEFKQKDYKK